MFKMKKVINDNNLTIIKIMIAPNVCFLEEVSFEELIQSPYPFHMREAHPIVSTVCCKGSKGLVLYSFQQTLSNSSLTNAHALSPHTAAVNIC